MNVIVNKFIQNDHQYHCEVSIQKQVGHSDLDKKFVSSKWKLINLFCRHFSHVEEKYFEKILNQPLPFYNCEYELRISGTVDTDRRIMSFVDTLWNLEVTGGSDQFEPLVVIDVSTTILI